MAASSPSPTPSDHPPQFPQIAKCDPQSDTALSRYAPITPPLIPDLSHPHSLTIPPPDARPYTPPTASLTPAPTPSPAPLTNQSPHSAPQPPQPPASAQNSSSDRPAINNTHQRDTSLHDQSSSNLSSVKVARSMWYTPHYWLARASWSPRPLWLAPDQWCS